MNHFSAIYRGALKDTIATVRIGRGAGAGLGYGIGFALYVSALYLVKGSKPFDAYGVTYFQVVAIYLVGSGIAGALVGLLSPWGGSRLGRIIIGFIAAVPVGFLIGLTALPPESWNESLVSTSLLWAAIIGPGHALVWEATA